jgi:hypothetical protein
MGIYTSSSSPPHSSSHTLHYITPQHIPPLYKNRATTAPAAMTPPTLRLEAAPVNWLGGAEYAPVPDGAAVPDGWDPPMTGEDG